MGLMNSIKDALGGDEGAERAAPPPTSRYKCGNCFTEWETTDTEASEPVCERCGSTDVRVITDD